jgi:tetratricopeptide (TPR) repeat protein
MRAALALFALFAISWGEPARAAPAAVNWSTDAQRWAPALIQILQRRQDVRPVRVRIHADPDYRATAVRWQERVRGLVADLNQFLGPTFGVRFDIESLRAWDDLPRGASAGQALELLEKHDPGTDVDWVVAFIAPLPLLSTSMHELGMARDLGAHLVLRGMTDPEEARAIKRLDLGAAETDKLYAVRKWHKEITVFLHEWAHTLGAVHSSHENSVMNPTYAVQATGFSGPHMTAIDLGLGCRLSQPAVPAWRCQPLLDHLQRSQPGDWYSADRQASIDTIRKGLGSGGPPAQDARASAGPVLPPAQARVWNAAADHLDEASRQWKAGALDAAVKAMGEAEREAAQLGAAGAPLWSSIARSDLALGALTRAEEALAHAGGRAEGSLGDDLLQARRRYGLPAAAVPRESEPAFAQTFDDLTKEAGGPPPEKLARALAAYPAAPGLLMLDCERLLRAGRAHPAEKACKAALETAPELAHAHYLLGMLAGNTRRNAEAVAELKKAIQLAPQSVHHWRALRDVYRSAGKRQELRELGEEYAKRFGSALD